MARRHKSAVARLPNKKSRVRLTHIEVRRGDSLRLRIAVAHDALAEVGDELGAIIKKIAPDTQTSIVTPPENDNPAHEDLLITREHAGDDIAYHTIVREHLTGLFSAMCDTALNDALEIAREERARRSEGRN